MKMYVLTGGPGSGKSSILRYLEIIKGQHVIREAAEDYISLRQAMGDAEPWLAPDFQTHITNLQLQRNERNQFYKVFMDRSVVDNLAYVESGGDIYREMFPHARSQKLEKVFLIENLGRILLLFLFQELALVPSRHTQYLDFLQ